ncbi:MAG: cysteine desulfurase family protein [Candidatus Nitrosoabyssus spongiisocia]|nr:MAG: cysteine desulfurase family protein [Nitrosopumilaceae archaeon AB1(1)]
MTPYSDGNSNDSIYLDSHSTTPTDPMVLEAMIPYFTKVFGNASSLDHSYGYDASNVVQTSRESIAHVIHAPMDDIIFTSGATESDNLALKGVMRKNQDRGNHIITCSTEHKAILDTSKYLESNDIKVTYLPVNNFGSIDLDSLSDSITNETVLISIMFANNEIGTIADIEEIGKIAHDNDILFHTDAAQAVGHLNIDVQKLNINLMSFSSHKIYGPKGIGALYVRGVKPRVKSEPLIHGGGQERSIRSGTLNVPGIVGFAKAIDIAQKKMNSENIQYQKWTDQIFEKLSDVGAKLNGHPTKKLTHNLNLRFDGIDGKAIINSVSKKIAISAGSACTTQMVEPSHVLLALGLTEEQAHTSIRIGCGRFNTDEEIKIATDVLYSSIKYLKKISM